MTAGGAFTLKKSTIENFPLKECSTIVQTKLQNLVNRIEYETIEEKKLFLIELADVIVFKIYELKYEDCKIVDPDFDSVLAQFGLTPEDYERMSVEELAELEGMY
jgi:hypothetical protein